MEHELSRPISCSRQLKGLLRVGIVLALVGIGAGCESGDGIIPPADETVIAELAAHRSAPQVVLAPPGEPGRRLVLVGQLVNRDTGAPLPQRQIQLFHTNAEGSYEEATAGDESTARLRGVVTSGPEGRFVVSTVFPGGYGSAKGSGGHIHTSIASARPEAYDIHFVPFASAGLRRWARRSRQGVIFDLVAMGDTLVAIGEFPIGVPDSTDS